MSLLQRRRAVEHKGNGSEPVILSGRAPVVGQSMLADLEQYWHALRGARKLPVRTEINPAQIDAILPYCFILERVAPGIGRMRIAGQALNAILGMEARGMPLSVFFTPAARPVLAQHLERVFAAPALLDLPLEAPRGIGRGRLGGRMLVLPLLGSDGTVSRALGAVMVDGVAGRAGRVFDIPAAGVIRCEVLEQPVIPARAVSGRDLGRGSHLRLVVSNQAR
jgi:hypothetical protein